MSAAQPTIIYTLDRRGAACLRPTPFLPIIRAFTEPAGIDVKTSDISGGGAHLGRVSVTNLTEEQRRGRTNLAETRWGSRRLPDTNIIKLAEHQRPSVPQLLAAHQGIESQGLRPLPGLPRRSEHRRRKGHQRALRESPWAVR